MSATPKQPFSGSSKLPYLDIDRYLQRIDVAGQQQPSLAFLKTLHRQHLLHIPFENLDIHWGREILLDYEKLFHKVVDEKRGGFCHELNGLFFVLLTQLGFQCYLAAARMPQPGGELSPNFEHMCVLAQVENELYLCDVGFGKGPIYPLRISSSDLQMSFNQFYRVRQEGNTGWWLEESDNGLDFEKKYLFSPKERGIVEFVDRCQYQQRSDDSHFRKQKMITQLTPDGRKTLTEKVLIVTSRGQKKEHYLLNEDDFYIKLEEHFYIKRPTGWA